MRHVSDGLSELTGQAQQFAASGDLAGAHRLLGRVLATADPDPGRASEALADAAGLQARVLIALGEPQSARTWAAFAHQAHRRLHGNADERTVVATATLAATLHRLGDNARATTLYHDVVNQLAAREGADSARVLAAEADLATVEHARGDCSGARARLADAYRRHEELYGEADLAGIKMLARLGAMQRDCGNFAEAHQNFQRARQLCADHLGADHPMAAQIAALARAPADRVHICRPPGTVPEPDNAAPPADHRAPQHTPAGQPPPPPAPAHDGPPPRGPGHDGPPPHGPGQVGPPPHGPEDDRQLDWHGDDGRVSAGHVGAAGPDTWPARPATAHLATADPALDNPGPDHPGPNDTGPNDTGPDDAGADDTGPDNPGADDEWPDDEWPADESPGGQWRGEDAHAHAGAAPVGAAQVSGVGTVDPNAPGSSDDDDLEPWWPPPEATGHAPLPPPVLADLREQPRPADLPPDRRPGAIEVRTGGRLPVPLYRPPSSRTRHRALMVAAGTAVVAIGTAAVAVGLAMTGNDPAPANRPPAGVVVPGAPGPAAGSPGVAAPVPGSPGATVAPSTGAAPGGATPPPAATTPGLPPPAGPTRVTLRDARDSVTLSWTYPSGSEGPVVIAGGRAGQALQAFQELPAGSDTYVVYGLNEAADYCFRISVVYAANSVATAEPVCTTRRSG